MTYRSSDTAFSQHYCPNDVDFYLGTWFLYYQISTEYVLAGKVKYSFGFDYFPVGTETIMDTCTNLDETSKCLVPETSLIGNAYVLIPSK